MGPIYDLYIRRMSARNMTHPKSIVWSFETITLSSFLRLLITVGTVTKSFTQSVVFQSHLFFVFDITISQSVWCAFRICQSRGLLFRFVLVFNRITKRKLARRQNNVFLTKWELCPHARSVRPSTRLGSAAPRDAGGSACAAHQGAGGMKGAASHCAEGSGVR